MHMEWSEEKFLKGIVGDKTKLRFWNKHQKIELVFAAGALSLNAWKSVEVSKKKSRKIGQ